METLRFEDIPNAIAMLLENQRIQDEKLNKILSTSNERTVAIKQAQNRELPILADEAVKILNLDIKTIYAKAARREIPSYKKGGRVFFYESELHEWMKSGRRKLKKELI